MRADCTSADSPLHGARTVRTRTREHVWLWWKLEVTGGQSGPGGRTVRSSNYNCTREGVFSGWAYDLCCGRSAPRARTVRRLFDSLYQRHCCLWWISKMNGGRSAGLFQSCTGDDVRLWWCGTHNCGWSAPGARTVRQGCNG